MVFEVKGYKVLIDDEDAPLVQSHTWWVSSAPEIDGHVICFSTRIGKRIVKLHRLIMGEPLPGMIVDHINRDRLDNRKANLRICGLRENNRNTGISPKNTSGYKGVSFIPKNRKWRAYIHIEGRQKHLGIFETAEEAAQSYETAAAQYFGVYHGRRSV
jgi:hypothetical protein